MGTVTKYQELYKLCEKGFPDNSRNCLPFLLHMMAFWLECNINLTHTGTNLFLNISVNQTKTSTKTNDV